MNTKPIRTVDDPNTALLRIEQLWGAASNSTEGNELEVLAMLVEKYEDEHFPIPASDPTEALKFRISSSGSLDCLSRRTS
ncbi:helix-turn-helix domain-containing protein [Pseudomonas frederiksbergensis]|uniref:helix-turn-helix domain-containing protein n=1 Tax=Pseudomonas frederiksbergensis TaxID=104087 RepID=UPI003D077B73